MLYNSTFASFNIIHDFMKRFSREGGGQKYFSEVWFLIEQTQ